MFKPTIGSFGSWISPISSGMIVNKGIDFDPAQIDVDKDEVYWLENRTADNGRSVIVCRTPDGNIFDITPPPYNVRTTVHEYGGGGFLVNNGTIYFSNFTDQKLYRQDRSSPPIPITPDEKRRYADGIFDKQFERIICACEDHTQSAREATNSLVGINADGSGKSQVLVSGNDFYASPRISPDGNHLAWLTWNHPNMPWDDTELWIGEISGDGSIINTQLVAGAKDENVCQPKFAPDGTLYFVSDRTGWWNLYRWKGRTIEAVCEMEAEVVNPAWNLGLSNYTFVSGNRIIFTYIKHRVFYLGSFNTVTRQMENIDLPFSSMVTLDSTADSIYLIAGSPTTLLSLYKIGINTWEPELLRSTNEINIDRGYLSLPQAIRFPTENGLAAHAFYYPPKNRDFQAPPGEHPPLLVRSHGGPTGWAPNTFKFMVQYWTSRGFAVVEVNYGGSTGFGREYRNRLYGKWGVVDINDCVNAARYLIKQGLVDSERIAIRGESAGGYTTLAALTFRDFFKAGASYFGVSDLEALATDTHKFESHYLDRLIGTYPERRDLYYERSPINFVENLSCPVIFFQGLEDKVVPPNQAEKMVEALRRKGVPVAYVPFEGEQHGFRKAQSIKRALDAELYFYSKIFRFILPEKIEPVQITNLD